MLFYLGVRFYLDSLSADLAIKFFIDELAHQLLAGLSPGDVVLNSLEEADVGCSSPDKHGSVYFPEVEAPEEKALLLRNVVNASNSHNEQELANPRELLLGLRVDGLVLLVLGEEGSTLRR